MHKGLIALLTMALVGLGAPAVEAAPAESAAAQVRAKGVSPDKLGVETNRYIVVLDAPTLLDELRQATGKVPGDDLRGDLRSGLARDGLQAVNARFLDFEAEFERQIGRPLAPVHRYTTALNGFSVELDAAEARQLEAMPGVLSVQKDFLLKKQTGAGPGWIGADRLWNGEGGLGQNRGEGVIIGVIDSGINWDHPSFQDPGETDPGAHDHVNPLGQQLGLCSDSEVLCNDKLIGVFDFVQDNPQTEVEEEFNNGFDNGAHGAHTAGTAGGNPVSVTFTGLGTSDLSGVAPNANIISYRVCYAGDPDDPDDDACQGSASLGAIDEAIRNGVDVINYSIGGPAFDPWAPGSTMLAFLRAVEAGVFVATSAGNAGRDENNVPVPGGRPFTVGAPATAPWITAVGSATHNRIFGGTLNTSGGGSTPPGPLSGLTQVEASLGMREIVYAGDFGNALCGTGPAELEATCGANTGASNPFEPGTFNGEIVVCDRGTYGRIEKSKNLQLAGAGGYVLANVSGGLENVVGDDHCLPAVHLRTEDGDALREWLANGEGHMGSLTGLQLTDDDDFGDRMSEFSSRGPNLGTTADILKPNLIAPGDLIFAAGTEGSEIIGLGGTSMASPHVAGAAALLRAYEPDLTPMQIASVLELTATDGNAKDWDFGAVDHFDTGAGRPRLLEAATVGVYLDEDAAGFRAANPNNGGDPKTLNLASITDAQCLQRCSFTRRIGAFAGGRTWTLSTSGFPAGVEVTVSPASFTLGAGQEQEIEITVDWSAVPELGLDWFFGKVHIDNPQSPQATMPVSIYASFGEFPSEWVIETEAATGSRDFELLGVESLPQATYRAGGLRPADRVTLPLVQDPTRDNPFDGGEGTRTLLFGVPQNALWFHAETLISPAEDVDLFVGLDSDGDGLAEESELVCASTTPDDIEFCDLFEPVAGTWWVVVQNWDDGTSGSPEQDVIFESVVIAQTDDSQLIATGPGITATFEPVDVRLSWEDVAAGPQTALYGAVGIGSRRDAGADAGVIPVRIQRTDVGAPGPMALRDGADRAFALAAGATHEALFIDVPPGIAELQIRTAAETSEGGISTVANNALELELVRVPWGDNPQGPAFAGAPGVPIPGSAVTVASASGGNGQGPRLTVDGGVPPGRYHAVISNTLGQPVSVRTRADLVSDGTAVNVFGGLWAPSSRPDIAQGFEYTPAGGNRAFLWYTYDADGSPAWYLAAAPLVDGNRWSADLLRFTNDGETQAATVVGDITISMLDESDAVLSWTLFGASGTERFSPLPRTCPEGFDENFTGVWFRGVDGLGGASVLVNSATQGQVHYLYDGAGEPRWLIASGPFPFPNALPLLQFDGFCPGCAGVSDDVSSTEVGTLRTGFEAGDVGTWTLDYDFLAPARGSVLRTDDIVKLTDELACVAP